MSPVPRKRRRFSKAGTPTRFIDSETGELTPMGEREAEDRHTGDWDEDEDYTPHGLDDHPGFE